MPAKKQPANRPRVQMDHTGGYQLGFWSALVTTIGGIVYFLVILWAVLEGQFTMPPSPFLQLFGGISSLLMAPVLVVLFASLHIITPQRKQAFSLSSLVFIVLFAGMVSINRFSQLGAVRQGEAAGITDGIGWFLAYGNPSVMFGLELLGWGWFLGLAALFAAPLFSGDRLQTWMRWLLIAYGVLGITSAVAYLVESPLSVVGFVAWGVLLFIVTGLLAVHIRRANR